MRIVANAAALCLITDTNGCWIKKWYKRRPQYTHVSHDRFNIEWAKRLQNSFSCDSTVHHWMGYSRQFLHRSFCDPYSRQRNTKTREVVTHRQRLSIILCHLTTGNNFEDLKFRKVTYQWNGIIVLETCVLLGRQKVSVWILPNSLHRLFNILCNPINITPRRSIIVCHILSYNSIDRLGAPFHSMYGATAPSRPWPPSKLASTRPCFQLFSSILLLLTAVMHPSEPRLHIWFLVFPLVLCCGRFHLRHFLGSSLPPFLLYGPPTLRGTFTQLYFMKNNRLQSKSTIIRPYIQYFKITIYICFCGIPQSLQFFTTNSE